jgi:hypothetical protein
MVTTMPKLLFARPPLDTVEERRIRKLAGTRLAPADWIRRAHMIVLSWDGLRVSAAVHFRRRGHRPATVDPPVTERGRASRS